ncbi:hypothetical protein N7539_005415 [Penicillium diatomitis]|uniref:Uncharacterized protein n=1 Tax=Penicillium diatomitis TaxID=2819901 RepID=A0A9W9X6Y1_9EURO|nr:uncharacterized protein N7539_005415 [Penicillium diatomitis]KAJ5485427.1 hypothetical protein N7539_005415 [Penicillium diatomitis]
MAHSSNEPNTPPLSPATSCSSFTPAAHRSRSRQPPRLSIAVRATRTPQTSASMTRCLTNGPGNGTGVGSFSSPDHEYEADNEAEEAEVGTDMDTDNDANASDASSEASYIPRRALQTRPLRAPAVPSQGNDARGNSSEDAQGETEVDLEDVLLDICERQGLYWNTSEAEGRRR